MKIFGSISRLVSILFRKDSQDLTWRPNQSTTYTAARDFQLPPGDADHVLVSATSTQTFTNKSIDASTNTLTNITNSSISNSAAIAYNKLAALTANKALQSDGSGFVSASAVTSTELGYLSGTTSAVQTQLDGMLKLAGRSGGQTAFGGTAASENLTLGSTAHSTKGVVKIDDGSNLNLVDPSVAGSGAFLGLGQMLGITSSDSNIGMYMTYAGGYTTVHGPQIQTTASRGTYSSPVQLNSSDEVWSLNNFVYDGSGYTSVAFQGSFATQAHSPGNLGTGLSLSITKDNTATLVNALLIDSTSITANSGLHFADSGFSGSSKALVSNSSKQLVELPSSVDGYVLTQVSGSPAWAPATASPVTDFKADWTAVNNTVTFTAATDKVNWTSNGLVNGQALYFTNSGGALASPLVSGTIYYVVNAAANDFEVAATYGGATIDLTTNGTGTSTAHVTSYNAVHSLGSTDVIVQLFDKADGSTIEFDQVFRIDSNNVLINGTELPSGSGTRVLILALS